MTTHKKLSARILSMALSVALVCTMLPTTALAAEGDTPLGASSINTVGTIKSFDKLEDRFAKSTGTNAPDHVYSLSVALNKPVEELQLPTELTAMVEITTTKPAEDVKDSGKVEETTTTTAQKNVAVSWNSDKEYKSDVNGQLIYTAVLPEGYTLADGVNLPQIYVMVGRQARTATAEIIVGGSSATSDYAATAAGLQKAFADIADGGTVKIGDNISMGTTRVTISGSKAITLDLNGKEITFGSVTPTYAITLDQATNPSLTIKDSATGGVISVTKGPLIDNAGTGSVTIVSGGLQTGTGNVIKNQSTGAVTVSGGTVESTGGSSVINNQSTGSVAVSGGIVRTTNGFAINNISTGKITISGTALVTSTINRDTQGTIGMGAVPTPADVILDIQGGTVSNTASPESYSVSFAPTTVTTDNLSSYYSKTGGTVGKVFPAATTSTPSPTIEIIIGGNYVCGNGTPLVIEKEGTGTTIYIDTNENGVKDSGEKSLADEEIANAPANGADLSTWRIYGGSNTAEVTGNTLVTMNDGEINTLCAGSRAGNINGNVHLTVNGGKISGWQLITGNANGGTITGNSTIEINDGEIKIVMVGSPNNGIISGNCTVTIKGGTITGQLGNFGTINGTKTVTITGGACALNKLSGITPTNVGGEELEFYKFTLSDATSTEIVNSITLVENYAYNLNGVAATATLGVFLPKTGKTFTKATVSTDLSTYAGSISNKAATLVKTVYTPVTGITGVPTTATVGTTLTLSGTVAPATATNKTIVWRVKTAGTTGATISGSTLSTTAAGTVVVTAIITNGKTASTNYTQDFTITVSAPKTPASIAVTTAPTKTAYTAGEAFNKTGMVVTATYIDSTTATVSGYTFSPTRALATTDTTITITYTENGTTVTTTQAITVSGGGGSGGGGGGSSSGGGTTPPAGGTAGGTNTPGKTVIDNPVGSTGSANPLAEAVKNATAAGTTNTTAYVNYANYTALTMDGLKAINDAAAVAVKDKNVKLSTKLQLDNKVGNVVLSRVTVDPAKLTAVMPDKLGLSVWFDQQKDSQVTAVKDKFERAFSNKLVTITFEQKTPLAVNMELALKPDLSELNTKNLYFYSYNPTTNIYTRIAAPAYWVDKNGYSHITAPFGGSIIITDSPLTSK